MSHMAFYLYDNFTAKEGRPSLGQIHQTEVHGRFWLGTIHLEILHSSTQ